MHPFFGTETLFSLSSPPPFMSCWPKLPSVPVPKLRPGKGCGTHHHAFLSSVVMLSCEPGPTVPAVERGVGIWTKVEFSGQEKEG